MSNRLDEAIEVIEEQEVKNHLSDVFNSVCGRVPDYRILIWGSVVSDKNRGPGDLDIMIEYKGEQIESSMEESIQSWVESSISPKDLNYSNFSHLDCVVTHETEMRKIISNSRNSKVYSFTDQEFIYFD